MPASFIPESTLELAPPPNASSRRNHLEVLRTHRALEALAPAWTKLSRDLNASPFQSPDWLIPFANIFVAEYNLRILAWFEKDELIALAPFYLHSESGVRKLFLLGSGLSDYLDILCRSEHCNRILTSLKEWLIENSADWDHCDLLQLPQNSPLLKLGAPSPAIPCPILPLSNSLERTIPARQLEKLRYYRRRAAKHGHFEIIRATEDNCEALMQKLFDLHRARWTALNEPGVLSDLRVQRFHLEVAKRFARSNSLLRLYAASLNSTIFAVLYAFTNSRRTFFYLNGFDPAQEKLGPGTLLIGHSIEQAVHEDHEAFDFLRGQEPYKYAWGAFDCPTFSVNLNNIESSLVVMKSG
jgi:CelD/BcsL family acetyltransferase involved in cellulose biosynthesis